MRFWRAETTLVPGGLDRNRGISLFLMSLTILSGSILTDLLVMWRMSSSLTISIEWARLDKSSSLSLPPWARDIKTSFRLSCTNQIKFYLIVATFLEIQPLLGAKKPQGFTDNFVRYNKLAMYIVYLPIKRLK